MSTDAVAAPTAAAAPVTPITISSGETPATFDELDAVESQAKSAKRAEKTQIKDTVKETVKALDKTKGDKDDKGDKTSKAADKEAKEGKEKDSKETGKEETKGKLGTEKDQKPTKVKAKLGEAELELDDETLIPVKVNGKEEFWTLKELRADKSGKIAWDKKFSESDKQSKEWQQKHDQAVHKIKSIMEEADPELKFYRMAEFAGQDPIAVRQKFLDENMKLLEKYNSMTDDERKADALAYENKILKHKQESHAKFERERELQASLDSQITKLGETHKFTKDAFANRFNEIKALKDQGKFDGKITPEFIAETIVKDRLWNAITEKQLDIGSDELKNQKIMDLVELSYAQGLSEQQAAEMADELWGAKSKTSVITETYEEQEELRTGKKKGQQEKPKAQEAVLFEELF